MSDQCTNCLARGNITVCRETECAHHESWYAVTQFTELSRLRYLVKELRGALAPFAEFAKHYPVDRKHGNRPRAGTLFAVESGDIGEAHITVENLHEAVSLLAKDDSILSYRPEQDGAGCQGGKCRHASDCAVHNGNFSSSCDCGADAILKESGHE